MTSVIRKTMAGIFTQTNGHVGSAARFNSEILPAVIFGVISTRSLVARSCLSLCLGSQGPVRWVVGPDLISREPEN